MYRRVHFRRGCPAPIFQIPSTARNPKKVLRAPLLIKSTQVLTLFPLHKSLLWTGTCPDGSEEDVEQQEVPGVPSSRPAIHTVRLMPANLTICLESIVPLCTEATMNLQSMLRPIMTPMQPKRQQHESASALFSHGVCTNRVRGVHRSCLKSSACRRALPMVQSIWSSTDFLTE